MADFSEVCRTNDLIDGTMKRLNMQDIDGPYNKSQSLTSFLWSPRDARRAVSRVNFMLQMAVVLTCKLISQEVHSMEP